MKKYVALILCFVLVFLSIAFIGSSNSVSAATTQELSDKVDMLDQEIKANKDKLKELESKKNSQQEYLNTLKSQISTIENKANTIEVQIQTIDKQIDEYNNQIKQLNNEIVIIEDEIEATKQEISSTKKKLEESKNELSGQLRAAYMSGKYSTLKILMGADSLASFLTRIEMMRRMSEEQKRVFDDFKKCVDELSKAKAKLVESKDNLDAKQAEILNAKEKSVAKKKELVAKQSEFESTVKQLESEYAKSEKFIKELDKSSDVYNNYIKNLEAEKAAADKAIEDAIKNYQSTSTNNANNSTTLYASNSNGEAGSSYSSSDTWLWPLGSFSCRISSGYGNRSASISGWSFHGGIDIAGSGIYGKPVYASRAGTVITVVWSNSGYGNYCVIDHGDGFSTVYAHCSSLCVTKGQYVTKGQQVANVGSTGNSTGPHLHFEVRYKGEKQNPLNYVKKP